ncbi:MAG: hypothetical protein KGZ83_16155 [Sulfuricella sp.]|nr:hypothetical protein [Sulfuricella sp.]
MMTIASTSCKVKAIRTTIPPPPEQFQRLQQMAEQHGLSLAGIVRQATNGFLGRTKKRGQFRPLASAEKDEG